MTIVVVGDALLDRDVYGSAKRLSADAPVPVFDYETEVLRPGGAGLVATLVARDGHEVKLVTALADDAPARALRERLDRAGVEVIDVGLDGCTPERVRLFAGGQQLLAGLPRRAGCAGRSKGSAPSARSCGIPILTDRRRSQA